MTKPVRGPSRRPRWPAHRRHVCDCSVLISIPCNVPAYCVVASLSVVVKLAEEKTHNTYCRYAISSMSMVAPSSSAQGVPSAMPSQLCLPSTHPPPCRAAPHGTRLLPLARPLPARPCRPLRATTSEQADGSALTPKRRGRPRTTSKAPPPPRRCTSHTKATRTAQDTRRRCPSHARHPLPSRPQTQNSLGTGRRPRAAQHCRRCGGHGCSCTRSSAGGSNPRHQAGCGPRTKPRHVRVDRRRLLQKSHCCCV